MPPEVEIINTFSDIKVPTMFDSSSDSEIERAHSVQSIPDSFETVPTTTDYKFKVGLEKAKFAYLLKKGKPLPYTITTTTKKGKGWFKKMFCFIFPNVNLS